MFFVFYSTFSCNFRHFLLKFLHMAKKLKFIISGLVLLGLSAILVIVYFPVGKNDSKFDLFTVSSSDITMTIGDEKSNFYTASHEGAEVEIIIDDETIVELSDGKLIALKVGKTKVTVNATYNTQVSSTSFYVQVVNLDYTYSIVPQDGATFSLNTLYQTSNSCQFIINVKDIYGQDVDYGEPTLSISNPNAILNKDFAGYLLINDQNCQITISFPEISYQIQFTVEIMF